MTRSFDSNFVPRNSLAATFGASDSNSVPSHPLSCEEEGASSVRNCASGVVDSDAADAGTFDRIRALCTRPYVGDGAIITLVVDEWDVLGKSFSEKEDGSVEKKSVVTLVRGLACQFHVPDHRTLEEVLRIASDNPRAAAINAGWAPAAVGEMFLFLSTAKLEEMGVAAKGVAMVDGYKAFARIKTHATPSLWQFVDRDVDDSAPDWAATQSFDDWLAAADKILPGLAKTKLLCAHSSSARVIRSDGTRVGRCNWHVWLKIVDAGDVERTRSAILSRAIELGLAWEKPRFSSKTGLECGRGFATIIDQSVWSFGRIVFVGRPVCRGGLTLAPQQFRHINGENDALDTSAAVVDVLKTFRATSRLKAPLCLQRDGKNFHLVMANLRIETEIELEDGRITSIRELMTAMTGKVRCQTPFRPSVSVAAFVALDNNREIYLFDSGTGIKHTLSDSEYGLPVDRDFKRLVDEITARLGALLGPENVPAVFDKSVLARAWRACFFSPKYKKVWILNSNDDLIELPVIEALAFGLRNTFGSIFRWSLLDAIVAEKKLAPAEQRILEKDLAAIELKPLVQVLMLVRQCATMRISIDMFAKRGQLNIVNGEATVVLPHRQFRTESWVNATVVQQVADDFTEHFPEFAAFLDLILNARFASDRRAAFVWLHATSSWGKGMLLAALSEVGLVVEIGTAEIEKALKGEPVGVSIDHMLRTWIICVDEFKAATSDLKRLNSQMTIATKHQLRCTVKIFTKLFLSAEDVRSLVGEGVEDQFNTRFAYLAPSTKNQKLEDRALLVQLGKMTYLESLAMHISGVLNVGVKRLCALGKIEASKQADDFVDRYQRERRLAKSFGRHKDTVDDLVVEIRSCLVAYARWHFSGATFADMPDSVLGIGPILLNTLRRSALVGHVSDGENSNHRRKAIVLRAAGSFVRSYIALSSDRSTIGKMNYKADEIAKGLNMRPDLSRERARVYAASGEFLQQMSGIVVFVDSGPNRER